jgi:hypothetical protein
MAGVSRPDQQIHYPLFPMYIQCKILHVPPETLFWTRQRSTCHQNQTLPIEEPEVRWGKSKKQFFLEEDNNTLLDITAYKVLQPW